MLSVSSVVAISSVYLAHAGRFTTEDSESTERDLLNQVSSSIAPRLARVNALQPSPFLHHGPEQAELAVIKPAAEQLLRTGYVATRSIQGRFDRLLVFFTKELPDPERLAILKRGGQMAVDGPAGQPTSRGDLLRGKPGVE